MKIGSSIFGGISASKAMKQIKKNIEQAQTENQNWYDRRYNEDATQRADAQRVLNMTREAIRERNRQAEGTAAVMGGTQESVAAEKAAQAQALADATSQIAVNGEKRKDLIESQYLEKKDKYMNDLNNVERERANAIKEAVNGVASAAGDIASAFDPTSIINKAADTTSTNS